jgi:hypothetical protein
VTPEARTTLIPLIMMFGLLLGTQLPTAVIMLSPFATMIALRFAPRPLSSVHRRT